MSKRITYQILVASLMQIMGAMYLGYVLVVMNQAGFKVLITTIFSIYALHLFFSGIQLLRLGKSARINAIANMISFSIISIGGIFWIEFRLCWRLLLFIIIFILAVYCSLCLRKYSNEDS